MLVPSNNKIFTGMDKSTYYIEYSVITFMYVFYSYTNYAVLELQALIDAYVIYNVISITFLYLRMGTLKKGFRFFVIYSRQTKRK